MPEMAIFSHFKNYYLRTCYLNTTGMKYFLSLIIAFSFAFQLHAADTLDVKSSSLEAVPDIVSSAGFTGVPAAAADATIYKFSPRQLIAPAALIGIGAIGSAIDDFKELDFGLRKPHDGGFVFEDVTQYVPAAGFYALKLSGVQSAHNYRDATVILAASYCITAVATKLVKVVADVERPNDMDNNSFPSGHSAVAFMGAEFLRMEYKDVSPWIGVAGYAVATGTALARIGHNEHWFTDLLAGAGVGILGTRAAYWIYPQVQKILFGKAMERKGEQGYSFMSLPYYNGESAGLSLALQF